MNCWLRFRVKFLPDLVMKGIFLLLFITQCAPGPEIESGERAFQVKKYMLAAELFKKELAETQQPYTKAIKAFRIAESYRKANKIDKAERWYRKAEELNYGALAIFTHGQMLKQNEQYEKAIEKFEKYIDQAPGNKRRARQAIKGCELALKWRENHTSVQVNEQKNINTRSSDHFPAFYKNDRIVFSSQRPQATGEKIYEWTGEKFSDLFIANIGEEGQLEKSRLFDESGVINTPFHEGVSCFDDDGKTIYFTRCGSEGKADDFCHIYQSVQQKDGTWTDPERIRFFADSNINVGHPSLSPNGRTLYFSSDAREGQGGKDIYKSQYRNGGWGTPVNLGSSINTPKDEMFPFIVNDTTLYFSSDGYIGMGGLDIYLAVKGKGGEWSVKNMRYPINSGGDDFGITVRDHQQINESGYFTNYGYFSSSRPGGKGNDDIYKFTMRKPVFFKLIVTVLKKVYHQDTVHTDTMVKTKEVTEQSPLPKAKVDLNYINLEHDSISNTHFTSSAGKTRYDLSPKTDYTVRASKEGFFTQSKKISTKGYKEVNKMTVTRHVELVLDTIIKEKEIVISNIYYDYDKATIREDAKGPLDTLARLLRDNPNLKVELGSHTDSRGEDQYNLKLSQRRAQSVVDYLAQKGVARDRLVAKGYGETQLLNECDDGVPCSEAQHQRNRRTTFKVIGIDREMRSIVPEDIVVDSARINPNEQLVPGQSLPGSQDTTQSSPTDTSSQPPQNLNQP